MKYLWIALLMFSTMARGQVLQVVPTQAPIITLGVTGVDSYVSGENGIDFFMAIKTDGTTHHLLYCTVPIGGHGTAGKHVECGLYANSGGAPSSLICVGQYTETGSETTSISIPVAGCGTLAANTGYWEFANTDDSSFLYATYSCGSTCTGTFPAQTTPSDYFLETYGSYASSPAVNVTTGQAGLTVALQ